MNETIKHRNIMRHFRRKSLRGELAKTAERVKASAAKFYGVLDELAKNPILREEFAFAMGWLQNEDPSYFIDHRPGKLSQLERARIDFRAHCAACGRAGDLPPYDKNATAMETRNTAAKAHLAAELAVARLGRRRNRPNESRCKLVAGLARSYSAELGKPTLTEGGPFPRFLSVVLSRCEGKHVTPRRAYDVWKDTLDALRGTGAASIQMICTYDRPDPPADHRRRSKAERARTRLQAAVRVHRK